MSDIDIIFWTLLIFLTINYDSSDAYCRHGKITRFVFFVASVVLAYRSGCMFYEFFVTNVPSCAENDYISFGVRLRFIIYPIICYWTVVSVFLSCVYLLRGFVFRLDAKGVLNYFRNCFCIFGGVGLLLSILSWIFVGGIDSAMTAALLMPFVLMSGFTCGFLIGLPSEFFS